MRTSTPGTSDRRRERGFTLIELSLVVLIIGIMLTLAVPRLSVIGEARLESEARKLAATLTYLHEEAALRGRIYRIRFDLDRESWTVASVAQFAEGKIAEEFVEDWDPLAEPRQLDEPLEIGRVETTSGRVRAGTADVHFFPESGPGGVTIRLADGERAVDLELDNVTGYVEVTKTAVGS